MRIFYKIISSLFSLIPTRRIIVFCSNPDFSDNSYAVCKYLASKGYDSNYYFYWLIDDTERKTSIEEALCKGNIKSRVAHRKSLYGFWLFLRSRYIFSTHGIFDKITLCQQSDKHICLWHGMPLKKIGAMIDGQTPCAPNCNITIATSHYFQKKMEKAFNLPKDKVVVTGQPRCDLLYEATDWFEKEGINRSKYHKIGIWMPTFRKSIKGSIRVDGIYKENAISFLNKNQLSDLNSFLKDNSTLLLIKIHPMDALQNEIFPKFDNIIIIYPQDFTSQLYPLLGNCDFLLTDYSSVFVDYELLNKPIGFVMNDIEAYNQSRGLDLDNMEEALPGPILKDFESLCEFIKAPTIVKRKMNYNEYYDNASCERLIAFLFKLNHKDKLRDIKVSTKM